MTDPAAQPSGDDLPLRISCADMSGALGEGTAVPLSSQIDGIVHYAGIWWVGYEGGWLRIADEHVLIDLDQAAVRLGHAAGNPSRGGGTVMLAAALVIPHREMQAAANRGHARLLTEQIPEFRRYHGAWWVTCPEGWLRITDTHLTACLDTIKMRLDTAEETAACQRTQRVGQETGWL